MQATHSEHPFKVHKPYIKPRLERVRLVHEEIVQAGCRFEIRLLVKDAPTGETHNFWPASALNLRQQYLEELI